MAKLVVYFKDGLKKEFERDGDTSWVIGDSTVMVIVAKQENTVRIVIPFGSIMYLEEVF